MEITAPTFNSLNEAQKRALILRDHLRWVEPHHLDSFIDGIESPDPPQYRKQNGIVEPNLILVKLRENASRFDLGNVTFPEQSNNALHAYLVFENGKVEMQTENAALESNDNPNSIPIHSFIAGTMVPMFRDKIGLIIKRINEINKAREGAYQSLKHLSTFPKNQTPKILSSIEICSTPEQQRNRPDTTGTASVINKRPIPGLDSIPSSLKKTCFDTIPEQVKVDLFDNIARATFPTFNNLITASSSIISTYSAYGNDFTEMHKAVVELKKVLQETYANLGDKVLKAPTRYRSDWTGQTLGRATVTQASASIASTDQTKNPVAESSKRRIRQPFSQPTLVIETESEEEHQDVSDTDRSEVLSQDSDSGEDEIPAQRPRDAFLYQQNRHLPPVPARDPLLLAPSSITAKRTSTFHMRQRRRDRYAPIRDDLSLPNQLASENPLEENSHAPAASFSASPHRFLPAQMAKTVSSGLQSTTKPAWKPGIGTATKLATKSSSHDYGETASGHKETDHSGRENTQNFISGSPTAPPPAYPTATASCSPDFGVSQPSLVSEAHIRKPKRRASASPKPSPAKKRHISSYTTAQLEKKLQTTQTSILRQWGSMKPGVAPKRYLNLLEGLEQELEKRESEAVGASEGVLGNQDAHTNTGGNPNANSKAEAEADSEAEASCSQIHHRQAHQDLQGSSSQEDEQDPILGLPRPIAKGMFGSYLGKSILGDKRKNEAEHAAFTAPVAPMLGTGVKPGLKKGVSGGESSDGKTGG